MTPIKTTLSLLVAILLFTSATLVVNAETNTDKTTEDTVLRLEKKIAELTKMIASLQAQLKIKSDETSKYQKKTESVPQDSSKYYLNNISENLYIGKETDQVSWLQDFLADDAGIYPEGKITGYYGPLTEAAVKRFQKKHGIETVGTVGPITRSKINELMKQESYKYDGVSKKSEYVKKADSYKVKSPQSVVNSIQLKSLGNGSVAWEVDGVSAKGFKVVWSQDSGATYPSRKTDKYKYLSDKYADKATLYPFEGEGTYHVRVCEYLGGQCGVYSNEVTMVLEK